MKIRINPIFFLFFLLLAFPPQCISRDAFSFEYGTKPSTFCTSQDMKTLPIDTFNTVIPSYLTKSTSGDQIKSVHLSEEGVPNMVGSIWYDSYQDWQNGFVVTFNMKVENVTCMTRTVTQCSIDSLGACFWEKYSTVESRCGADGYAFVLQSSGPYAKGQFAGGLGYKTLSNVFAVEFDTWVNEDLNDPITTIERHISVIATKGVATANEVDAIAWNDNPLNFKNNRSDGFLVNPTIKIEYLNHRLRVFINNVLQLAYYDVIDFAKLLGISNSKFYMGLTSSTGTYTQDVELTNWNISLVLPSSISSTAQPSSSNPDSIRSNEYFFIDLFVKDSCLNRYVPTEADSINDVSWVADSNNNCKLRTVTLGANSGFSDSGPSYQASFECSHVGTKTIQLTYKGKAIKNSVSIEVVANVMTRAKTNIIDLILANKLPNIDSGFDFTIIPWDSGDNLAVTTSTEILNKISVVWENPADTRRDHVVTKNGDGSYNFHITTDKAYTYIISSTLFKNEIQGSSYNITTIHGAPDANNSFVKIYDSSDPNNLVEFQSTKISAGQNLTALIILKDRLNNTVPIRNTYSDNTSYSLIENGLEKVLDRSALNEAFLQMDLRFQMTKKGSNMFLPSLGTLPLTCLGCIFTVEPLESVFSNADLFVYSNDDKTYIKNKNKEYNVQKGDKFSFLMVLKDKYDNVIDKINSNDYEAQFSGNFMKAITLKLTSYTTSGLQVQVADSDLSSYQNLVGAANYAITIKEISTKAVRIFSLTIVSDGSDSDATNDNYVAIKTKISWAIEPVNSKCIVGNTYRVSLTLLSSKGLRYNDWIEPSLIEASLNVFFPENNETVHQIRKDLKPGMYLLDFILTKVSAKLRTLSFKVNGSSVLSKLRCYDIPAHPYQAFVDNLLSADQLQMNSGTILKIYTFTYTLFDKYMNPTDPANGNVDLVLRLNSQPDLVNIKPDCTKNGLGVFPCSFTPNVAGEYSVKSDWFRKGSYSLSVSKGSPDISFIEGGITNDVTGHTLAGNQINFRLIVKDQQGSQLNKSEVKDYITNFTVTLVFVETNTLTSLPLTIDDVQDSGEILTSIQITTSGHYKFLPAYQSQDVKCSICAVTIEANLIDINKVKVSILQGDSNVVLQENATILLDNNRVVPSFLMEFYDTYGNKRQVETNFSNFQGRLTVPKSVHTYTLEGNNYMGNILFTLKSGYKDYYQQELSNNNCNLSFTAVNIQDQRRINKSFKSSLLGGEFDNQFTYDEPDPQNIILIPNKITSVAGQFITLSVELRAQNGKLFYDQSNKGFYPDSIVPFKLIPSGETNGLTLQVTKGKFNGTYSLTFNATKSYYSETQVFLSYSNYSENSQYIQATNPLKLIVNPDSTNYVVLKSPNDFKKQCQADTRKSFSLLVFDRFNNQIYNSDTNTLGLKFIEEGAIIIPTLFSDSNGISVSFPCKKAGLVTFFSIGFRAGNITVNNYTFTIVAGEPDPFESKATLSLAKINASESAEWRIYPVDIYGNKIGTDQQGLLKKFTSTVVKPNSTASQEIGGLSSNYNEGYLYYPISYDLAGIYRFQAFLNNLVVFSNNFMLEVISLEAEWGNVKLAVLSSETGVFNEYETNEVIEQNIFIYPEFRINLYDIKGNNVGVLPTDWSLGILLTSEDMDYPIIFCKKNNSISDFIICNDSTLQPSLDKSPKHRWDQLVQNRTYSLMISNKGVSKLGGYLNITGNETDNGASNLPIDIKNTIIIPGTPLITTAGVAIAFWIELRTSNANLRPNWFYEDPNANISVALKYDNDSVVSVSFQKGVLKGRYKAIVVSTKTYSEANPNILTLSFDNVKFNEYQPNLIVGPGDIAKVVPYDTNNSVILTVLPNATLDNVYSTYFQAFDKWNNLRPLVSTDVVKVLLVQNNEEMTEISFQSKFTANNLYNVYFQPQKPGSYAYQLALGDSYTFEISVGEAYYSSCIGYVNVSANESIIAGAYIEINVDFYDKYGNTIVISENHLRNLYVNYFYQRPDVLDGFIIGNGTAQITGINSIRFLEKVQVKGIYIFKVSIKNNAISMKDSTVKVIPGDVNLTASNLRYYDSDASRYLLMNIETAIKEDNLRTVPSYTLELTDSYGNSYDIFPIELIEQIPVVLFGHDYIETVNPLTFSSNTLLGNKLFINFTNLTTTERYKDAVYKTEPYNLRLTLQTTNETILYQVILLGEGKNDSDAESEKDLNISLTILSKNSLSFKAGEYDTFIIELRDINNKRKVDAVANFSFAFEQAEGLNDGNFKAFSIDGDLRGRFLVTVTGTKANTKIGATVLSITINNVKLSQKVLCNVLPNQLNSIKIPTDLTIQGTTDSNYFFYVIPYDLYSNIVTNALESDVNLQIKFPSNRSTYQATKDIYSGKLVYSVYCKDVGVYIIQSPLLDSPKNFTIVPGAPSILYSTVYASPNQLTVGQNVSVSIILSDSNNNKISPKANPAIKSRLTVSVMVGTVSSSYNLTIDTLKDQIITSFTSFSAGVATITVLLDINSRIPCESCSSVFIPGPLDLTKTKFFVQGVNGYTETKSLKIAYGTSHLNFIGYLYDSYNNVIVGLNDSETFNMTMSGNYMTVLNITVLKQSPNVLHFELPSQYSDILSRVVPSANYSLNLTYLVNGYNKGIDPLNLVIMGQDNGAGNGPWTWASIDPVPTLKLVAGIEGFFHIILYTQQNRRFNGIVNISTVQIFDESDSRFTSSEKLNMTVYPGDSNGKLSLGFIGKVAISAAKQKNISFSIAGEKVNQKLFVYIIPNIPDLSYTELTQDLTVISISEVTQYVSLKFFDTYNNAYPTAGLTSKVYAKVQIGQANFSSTSSKNEYSFIIPVTPIYPPTLLQLMIYYQWSDTIIYPILARPLVTNVKTYLDPNKTEIIGSSLAGITSVEQFSYYVLLKDKAGYCFEESRDVIVNITGPFIKGVNNTITNVITNLPIFMNANETGLNGSRLTTTSYACQKVYYGNLIAESLSKVGYYTIDVYIKGELNNKPVRSINYTYVSPGPIAPEKSILSLPELLNKGRTPLNLEVNTPIIFKMQLADKFGNIIQEYRNETTLSVGLSGFGAQDYNMIITNKSDGSYSLNLTVQKIGSVNSLQITLNKQVLVYSEIQKFDIPDTIKITAGPCSTKHIFIDNSIYLTTNVTVGEVNSFIIQCRDEFNNVITKGGSNFQTMMSGNNIETVGVAYASTNITDNENGNYTYSFTVAWAGQYSVSILLNSDNVANPFIINASRSHCPNISLPLYCENTKVCTSSYLTCGYDVLKNCTATKPYRCKVNGQSTCVEGSYQCDCPENYYKCPADNKCVLFEWADVLCSNVIMFNCPNEYPYLCSQGSCRTGPSLCPSQPGCPPSYYLCPDQTCALNLTACRDFSSNEYNCPFNQPWKCEDQSCVADPTQCSTRITCNSPTSIICPDRTCAKSELECRAPAKCVGQYLCPDQSCRPSREDCPRAVTCSIGQALCEDKTCKTDCSSGRVSRRLTSIKKLVDSSLFGRILQDSSTVEICRADYHVCPGGECVTNEFLCPSVQSCGADKRVCPDYSCAGLREKCVVKSCSNGKLLCWDGKCVDSYNKCSTRSTCPKEIPIKCSDGSCASKVSLCPDDIQCAPYSPYRCATGECRANEKECPTLITCPANKPIQCTDGSCVVSPSKCLDIALLRKCDSEQILCPDGSCALSKLLCPTIGSCGNDQIRCWDTTCVNNASDCDSIEETKEICPDDRKLRCPDGSCRSALKDCPTQLICPITKPVKCDDGACKQSIQQCATGTDCGYGLKRCPDGSCSSNEMNCGTPVTCSKDAPYICYDSTCKKDPRDCPNPPICTTSAPILCPDGTCTSQRVNCKRLERCDSKTPVRCPNMNCYASSDDCLSINGCPAGRVMCEDGSCASYVSFCPTTKCPEHLTHQCRNGMCVNNLALCDNNITGCPYSKPYKCPDGLCTHNISLCNSSARCPEGFFLCQDGSCSLNNASCTNILGCPWESPVLCASGNCIDPSKGSCPVASCPKATPIKCFDGLCASSITMCSSFFTAADIKQCINDPVGNMVPCADGRCVISSDLCKPVFKCPSGQVRCGDGSCRSLSAYCPLINSTCPENKPFRCNIGACAATQQDCPNDINGCPFKAPVKCEATGSCVKTNDDCAVVLTHIILLNNCTMATPHRCSNGTCVKNEGLCLVTDVCSSGLLKCPNGLCVSKKSECNASCTKYTCPDGTCKSDLSECLADNGCPLHKPFYCLDGSCKQSPLAFNGELGCLPNVVCPDYKPYLCSNGECQGAPSQCQVQKPCPDNLTFQCPDYSCVATREECRNHNLCPIATPVLCGSGRCEKTPMECQSSTTNIMYCPDEKPVLCASGRCEKYSWNCTDKDTREGNLNKARRLLQNSNSSENLIVCSDGSFRTDVSSCGIISTCLPGQYRCNSSACVDRKQDCEVTDALLHSCVDGTTRCLDGICRSECPNYQGCPFEKNFHCANGFCAKNEGECAGDSVCHKGYFRCIDNTCVYDVKTCSFPLRNYPSEQLQVTVSSLMTTQINFIQKGSSSSINLGNLILPAGALVSKSELNNTKRMLSESNTMSSVGLLINPVAHNQVIHYNTSIHPTRIKYSEQLFPYNMGSLSFHQAVRSPIVNLSTVNRPNEEYNFPLILELSADIISNSSKENDYCLATIDDYSKKWECVTRNLTNNDDLFTDKFTYPVAQDGIYTVIFSPPEEKEPDVIESCGWFCENKYTILYVFGGIIVAGLVGSYVIWRVSRYVTKYKAAKKQMANFREQITEMEKAKTDVVGQTLRDKIEGISFTTNPAFKKETSEIVKEREKKLLEFINEIHQKDKKLENSNKELEEKNKELLEKIEELKKELGKEKLYGESMDVRQIEREEFE